MLVKYNYMVMPAQIQFHGVWKIIILVLKKKKKKKTGVQKQSVHLIKLDQETTGNIVFCSVLLK